MYVIQVMGGREKRVLALLRKLVDEDLAQESFLAQYEVMKKYAGEWRKRTEILLPGYIFVVTDEPEKLAAQLRRIPAFTRILGNNDMFIPLNDQETAFISAFTDIDHRTVELSEGVIEGDAIRILKGPLMDQLGSIKRIDRHKRLAYLEIEILGRKKTIKLGLEIVAKRPEQPY